MTEKWIKEKPVREKSRRLLNKCPTGYLQGGPYLPCDSAVIRSICLVNGGGGGENESLPNHHRIKRRRGFLEVFVAPANLADEQRLEMEHLAEWSDKTGPCAILCQWQIREGGRQTAKLHNGAIMIVKLSMRIDGELFLQYLGIRIINLVEGCCKRNRREGDEYDQSPENR